MRIASEYGIDAKADGEGGCAGVRRFAFVDRMVLSAGVANSENRDDLGILVADSSSPRTAL
jgi:hypothetical protein